MLEEKYNNKTLHELDEFSGIKRRNNLRLR